ncbi:IS66 family insertion sequence element accessory protein TnpB [Globicatella sanguinis]
MIINLDAAKRYYIMTGRTDLRKEVDSLAALVQNDYQLNPFEKNLFLFCGSRLDRFKALYWDGQGFWLLYKRYESGRIHWPRQEESLKEIDRHQLIQLMDGFLIEPSVQSLEGSYTM